MLNKRSLDARRELVVPGDTQTTLNFCCAHWVEVCRQAIQNHDAFFVALSGGTTPRAIFEKLTSAEFSSLINWSKLHLFWSDERAVPPDHKESNYHMAMQAGLSRVHIPSDQIHRMHAEEKIQEHAHLYEETIRRVLQGRPFDLVMLGVGEDGHTASLFPGTEALYAPKERLVVANYIPEKKAWRMTLTFSCINQARHIAVYALGASKKLILKELLSSDTMHLPAQRIGTKEQPALWIVDEAAGSEMLSI